MRIIITHKNVYGNDTMYIQDQAIRNTVSLLTGCTTIRPRDIKALQSLGHEIIDMNNVLTAMVN